MSNVAPGHALLRGWRESLGLTQVEFAKKLGVPQTSLSAYETGRLRPGLDVALRIEAKTDGAVKAADWSIVRIRKDLRKAG